MLSAGPRELFEAGRLDEAIEALGVALRSDPTDAQRRVFLFELLAFAGDYERAEKQLDVLAANSPEAAVGTLVYRAALRAERVRERMFESGEFPAGPRPASVAGTLNGRSFETLTDADPRVGARLEVFAGGQYMWLPLEHVAAVSMEAPTRLRDTRWSPAVVRVGPGLRDVELGEILLPALSPGAWHHPDSDVRLGRATDWDELADGSFAPAGQKMLLVDGALVPLLSVRELAVAPPAGSTSAAPN